MRITIKEMGLAFRKAKVDLYYSSHASLELMAKYEDNLYENLNSLLEKINDEDEGWIESKDFLGTWVLVPKEIHPRKYTDGNKNGLVFSSPLEEWESVERQDTFGVEGRPIAEFRVMAKCGMDFHVLSTLWMLKVGHRLDEKLSNCAYGNRLRRTKSKRINPLSLGSFAPYLKPFREWRDRGVAVMKTALERSGNIVALTADVSSFYHELNPGFLLDKRFCRDVLGVDLSADDEKLHRLFVRALQLWAKKTPLKKGLPVGLPAAAVVANVALIELDNLVERKIAPLYYGRYVDDIILVMENGERFQSAAQLWEWVFARFEGKLAWANGREKNKIRFKPAYFESGDGMSNICFSNSKNKVFILSGATGKSLIDSIARQIYERASEWRAMPRLPNSAEDIGTDLLTATQSNGEAADNLRKADALTLRRAGFAIRLRDFEAYERDLEPDAWKAHRRAFFDAIVQHVLVLPRFFELANYLPRIIRLATACEDFSDLKKIMAALEKLFYSVESDCDIAIKARKENGPSINREVMLRKWRDMLFLGVRESIAAAFPPKLSLQGRREWDRYMAHYVPFRRDENIDISWPISVKECGKQQKRYFYYDIGHMPFRFSGLSPNFVAKRGVPNGIPKLVKKNAWKIVPDRIVAGIRKLAKWINIDGLPHGLLFSTRPFSLAELFLLGRNVYKKNNQSVLGEIVMAVRGFSVSEGMPRISKDGQELIVLDGAIKPKYRVAVSSWGTRLDSWVAAVTKMKDPDFGRYSRLNSFLDGVISSSNGSRYLILPELALPAHWFIRVSRKLQARGISLISGVEYLHASGSIVHNQVWAALSHDGMGFSSMMIYRQDKQRPALHEELELRRLAGVEMRPKKFWSQPPIVRHGEFRFSILICSELTNIQYRSALRGRVDAIFVPEWNQDTETFNALVESAALDIHAYVVQCNDRQYGDSRIRAPYKESWRRDVLKVKGGVVDYCVIGEIDVLSLRQFQSGYKSPNAPFKPVPDGFKILKGRKCLPI